MKTQFEIAPRLNTARLELRPFELSDAPDIFVLRSDERVIRYTGRPKAVDLDDAVNLIDMVADSVEKGESVNWGICEKGNPRLIGNVCLWKLQPEKGIAELGYTLHPDFWGKGIANEAVKAAIEFGFETMKTCLIEAYVDPENMASIKLLDRQGFLKTGTEEHLDCYTLVNPSPGKFNLETERLTLREFTPQDAPFLFELLNSDGWLKNIGDRGVRTIEDARRYAIYRLIAPFRLSGFGFFALESKSSKQLVGTCGLVKREFLDDHDIGYALSPQFFGCGYAFEAAETVLAFAMDELKLSKVMAITIETNQASIKLLNKLGFQFKKVINEPATNERLLLFSKKY